MNTNKYQIIPLEKLPGKKYFKWFNTYDIPNYTTLVEMDITRFYKFIKEKGYPFYYSMIYLVNEALNQFPEFRYRMVGDQIVLFDHIDPSFTIMTDRGLYDNVNDVKIRNGFQQYLKDAQRIVAEIKTGKNLDNECFDDCVDQFYFTCIPWVSVKMMTHPMDKNPSIYVPRAAWDKIVFHGDKITVNLNLVVHHAFVDGYPCAMAFLKVQEYLDKPEEILK